MSATSESDVESNEPELSGPSEDEMTLYETAEVPEEQEHDLTAAEMASYIQRVEPIAVSRLSIDTNLHHGQLRVMDPTKIARLLQSFDRDRPTEPVKVVVWKSKCVHISQLVPFQIIVRCTCSVGSTQL